MYYTDNYLISHKFILVTIGPYVMSILPHDAIIVSYSFHCRLAVSVVCCFLCGLWKCEDSQKSQRASIPQDVGH